MQPYLAFKSGANHLSKSSRFKYSWTSDCAIRSLCNCYVTSREDWHVAGRRVMSIRCYNWNIFAKYLIYIPCHYDLKLCRIVAFIFF